MKILVPAAAALLLAGAAHARTSPGQTPPAQTPPAQTPAPSATPVPPVSTLTRDLNSGPPAPAVYLAPATAPAPVVAPPVAPSPAAVTTTPAPRPTTPAPSVAPTPLPTASAPFTPPAASPVPAPTVPLEAVVATPPPPAAPAVTVLDGAARAPLPFTADLPPGLETVPRPALLHPVPRPPKQWSRRRGDPRELYKKQKNSTHCHAGHTRQQRDAIKCKILDIFD